MTHERSNFFAAMRISQTGNFTWQYCCHSRCRAEKSCTGGPRGTCAFTGGFTACSSRGKRMIDARERDQQWDLRINSADPPGDLEMRMRMEEIKLGKISDLRERGL